MKYLTSPIVMVPIILTILKMMGYEISWPWVFCVPIATLALLSFASLLIGGYFTGKLILAGPTARLQSVPGGVVVVAKRK